MEEFKIPLRNKNSEIIAYTIIDKVDYDFYKNLKFNKNTYGYAQTSTGLLHRLIMNAKKGDPIIDHINGNKLDNRKLNLRFSNKSYNGQNKKKKENTTSKYIGVSKDDYGWITSITHMGKHYSFLFQNEEHAGYYYNILALKYFGKEAKINETKKPDNFEEPQKKEKRVLPKGIYKISSGNYKVQVYINKQTLSLGSYKTLDEAKEILQKKNNEIFQEKEDERLSKPILRNILGQAIIEMKNNEKTIVNDDNYHELIKYSWSLNNGYVQTHIGGKVIKMHRFIINANENEIIDHINHNRSDNRRENLRISNESLNSHNKSKAINTTSKYHGVRKTKFNTYQAIITKDKQVYCIGNYKNEIDAAIAYNKKAIELYGTYANLNIIKSSSILLNLQPT